MTITNSTTSWWTSSYSGKWDADCVQVAVLLVAS